MDLILSYNFLELLTPSILIPLFLGSFVGMLIGALPGLGAAIAIVMLLPLTYSMNPLPAILMLLSAYQSAEYGGSISSVVLAIPGTPAAVATVIDGSALAKKGEPGKALAYSLHASSIGGIVGALGLMFLTFPLAAFAMKLSDPEYFLIAIIGLITAASVGSKNILKSIISVAIGLLLSTVGTDMFTGITRYTFGTIALTDGIKMISVLVGLYAVTELFEIISSSLHNVYVKSDNTKGLKTSLNFSELKGISRAVILGSTFGVLMGGIPGLGPPVAAFLAYGAITKFGNKKIPFGEGNPLGIAAPESANNAGVGTNIIPVLVFGIPSNATIAIVMSAFIVHGIKPGPKIFQNEPKLIGGLLFGFLLTSIAMYIVGKLLTPLFARSLLVSNDVLVPVVMVLSLMGAYASSISYFAVFVTVVIGAIGYLLKKLDFSMSGIVLAFVLGSLIEESYRRALLTSRGSNLIFVQRPICLSILIISAAVCIGIIIYKRSRHRRERIEIG